MKFNIGMLNVHHVKGLHVPDWEKKVGPAEQERALRLAEELGYYKANVPEHFIISEEHRDLSGDHYPHAVTALAWMGGFIKKMKLSSHVTILPLINPIAQAKMWATLDWLTGGRAVLLAGVGWHKEEYEMLGVPFSERGRMCDEYVAAMIELWSSDNPTFEGRYVKFRNAGFAPKPVQRPGVPIWFGGDAEAVLRRVARWGAGWSPFQTPPDQIPEKLDWMRQQPDYHGGSIDVEYSLMVRKLADDHVPRDAPEAAGTFVTQELVDQMGYLSDLGVTETYVPRPDLKDYEAYLDWMRWVAEDIMPKV